MESILMLVVNYVSLEIKIIAVKHSLIGMESLNQSAARFDVSRSTLQNMKCLARKVYAIGLGKHHYSEEIKCEAVEVYCPGG